jgi:hypothetical protein
MFFAALTLSHGSSIVYTTGGSSEIDIVLETSLARNRFEKVDELQPDAILLALRRNADAETGSITFPASASGGRMTQDQVTAEAPAQDAFRNAIKLANQMKIPLVVRDPDDVWKADWGVLYRPVD